MTSQWSPLNCTCTNSVAYVACTWLSSCRSALPGGTVMVLHLYLTATYKSHEVQLRLLFRDVIQPFRVYMGHREATHSCYMLPWRFLIKEGLIFLDTPKSTR